MTSAEVGVRGVVIAKEVLATFEVIKFRALPVLVIVILETELGDAPL
jgi:hypothetical protein